MGVHLMGRYLIGMHLVGRHLMGMKLMSMHLMGLHLMGMHLIGMHLIGRHLICRHLIGRRHISMHLIGVANRPRFGYQPKALLVSLKQIGLTGGALGALGKPWADWRCLRLNQVFSI